jgi:glycosyltransferase involved in cell wall biosynthesis
MNVLMVCALDVWSLSEGRGAPSLHRTLRAYGERGHRIHCVMPTVGANHFAPGGRPSRPEARPSIDNVTFHSFHLPSLGEARFPLPPLVAKADQKLRFAVLFPMMAARQARRILRHEPIDLLYGYEVHGTLAVRLLRRQWRLPTVVRFQGTVMHPALSNRLALVRKYEEVLALRTPADLYIMTDDGTRGDEVLARLNPGSEGRVRFWRNGLERGHLGPMTEGEAQAARRSLGIDGDRFVMMTASRLAAWKRVDRAVRALPLILASVPDALLLVVGDGEERAELEALGRRLGVSDALRFVGAVGREEVGRYMGAADLFLALADLSNVGNPLLEAMTCGKAIVTLDAGDTGELIRDGETGVLLPTGEPERVAEAVVGLARDESLRRRLGEGALRYASSHFWTWEERMAAELTEVERLVAAARGSGCGSS